MPVISTGGWDTAFALSLTEVNRHFARSVASGKLKIPDLNWTSKDKTATVQGVQFDPWQLSSEGMQGAGGTLVSVRFPIRAGTVRVLQDQGDLQGVLVTARVSLLAVTTPQRSVLKLGTQHGVTVTKVVPGKITGTLAKMLNTVFTEALSAAIASFDAVFASVDFNVIAAAEFDWLAPKAVGYAFLGGHDDPSSYLGVLCMTGNFVKGNPTPPASLSQDLLAKDSNSAFAMSQALLFRDLLLKGLTKGLGKGDSGSFKLSDDGRKILKTPGTNPIYVQTQPVDLSILYTVFGAMLLVPASWPVLIALGVYSLITSLIVNGKPNLMGSAAVYIESLEVVEVASGLQFTAGLRCDIVTGLPLPVFTVATARLSTTATVGMVMDKGVARLAKVGDTSTSTPTLDAPDWLKNSSTGLSVVLGIVMTIVMAVTEGLAAVLIAIDMIAIQAALNFLPELIRQQIQARLGEGVPAGLEMLAVAAASPLSWSNCSFTAKHVTLAGDLGFTGDFAATA